MAKKAKREKPAPVPAAPPEGQDAAESASGGPETGESPSTQPDPSPETSDAPSGPSTPFTGGHPLTDTPRQTSRIDYLDLIRRAERQSQRGQGLSVDRECLGECADALRDLLGLTLDDEAK